MSIANVVTRGGPSVSGKAKIAYVVTHGLGNYSTSPVASGVTHVHRKRGQPGHIIRGGGAHGGMVK